jgi:uncharacterized protein with HEPN domain
MRDDSLRFRDIIRAITQIEKYGGECSKNEFTRNELVQVWVVHHLQLIGEAARAISLESRERYPSIPWAKIIGLRNILVHHYFAIDPEEIWNVMEQDLPALKASLETIQGTKDDEIK